MGIISYLLRLPIDGAPPLVSWVFPPFVFFGTLYAARSKDTHVIREVHSSLHARGADIVILPNVWSVHWRVCSRFLANHKNCLSRPMVLRTCTEIVLPTSVLSVRTKPGYPMTVHTLGIRATCFVVLHGNLCASAARVPPYKYSCSFASCLRWRELGEF